MAVFRILQISDLHFGHPADHVNPLEAAVGGRNSLLAGSMEVFRTIARGSAKGELALVFSPSTFNPDVAQVLLRELHAQLPDLDAVVVTGDLATTGENPDLALAKSFFRGALPPEWNPLGGLPSLLADSEIPILCMPGNHDRYTGRLCAPGNRNFEEHFGKLWDFDRGKAYQISGKSSLVKFSAIQSRNSVLFICMADFSLADVKAGDKAGGWIGQGRITEATLEHLEVGTKRVVKAARLAGCNAAAIWAVHFPPAYPNISPKLDLHDSRLLVEAATRCDVRFILAGHTHQALWYEAKAATSAAQVICCGASAGLSQHDAFSFTLLEVTVGEGEPSVTPVQFLWNREQRRFESTRFPTA